MLSALTLAALLSVTPASVAGDVNTLHSDALDAAFAAAQVDFDARYRELGLQGSAPLVGLGRDQAPKDKKAEAPAQAPEAGTQPAPHSPQAR